MPRLHNDNHQSASVYLLYRLQGLSVFLLCLLDLCQAATPDVSLCLLLERLRTHTHIIHLNRYIDK